MDLETTDDLEELIARFQSLLDLLSRLEFWTALPKQTRDQIGFFLDIPTGPLTSNEVKAMGSDTLDLREWPMSWPRHSTIMKEILSKEGLRGVVQAIRACQIKYIYSFHLLEVPFEDVKNHYEYGLYKNSGVSLAPGKHHIITAWFYGFSWNELLLPAGTPVVHPMVQPIYNIDLSHLIPILEAILQSERPMPVEEFLKITQERLTHLAYLANNGFSVELLTDVSFRLCLFVSEVNLAGLEFHPAEKQQELSWNGDFRIIPLVQHLNHVKLLPVWPRLWYRNTLSPLAGLVVHPLPDFLHSIPHLPYPTFSPRAFPAYPKALRTLIVQFLCIFNRQKRVLHLGRDLIPLILNYVVFNYYHELEEKIERWKELGGIYNTSLGKDTMRTRALDAQIVSTGKYSDEIHEGAYAKALNDLGYANIRSSRETFISYFKGRGSWKVFKAAFPDQSKETIRERLEVLGGECYDHWIAISLIKSGKIKISTDGHIVDLGDATMLTGMKMIKDRASGLRLLSMGPSAKKRRVGNVL